MTTMTTGRLLAAFSCAALASCVPPPAPPPPAPAPTPTPAPQPSAAPTQVPTPTYDDWMDAPRTPGDWYYEATATGGAARYGPPQSEALFSMICDRPARAVSLVRTGRSPVAVQMRVRTETADRVLDAVPSGGALPTLVATLPARDPFLEAIAFSKGRFAVEIQGLATLYLPSWPEITRVIEDCR